LKWRVSKHAIVLKSKNRSFFFLCRSLWIFAFCRFFISLCFSNIFAYVIFFVSCLFLNFFCHQSTDCSCSYYILTQIWLMLFFRTSRLEMKSYKTCKSLKEQKMVSLFLCITLWIFAFFFRFFISLRFLPSWHLLFFWVWCVFLNFLVINELNITLVTAKFLVFEGNSWSCSMFFILFFYFYGDFLFILYSSSTFTHIYSF